MKTNSFEITIEDVSALEKTIGKCLTVNNQPLDLMCTANDLWTEEEYEENNWEYRNEQENYLRDNLDYE
jgi:hypothetical protein